MAFPSSPSNGDLHTEFGRTFKYSSASNSWSVATPDAPVDNTPTTQGYVDAASLPLADVVPGSKAFVEDGNKLFIFTGSGWFEIATINTAPTITQGANASYTLTPGTPTVITLQATDPEGTPIIWGYQVTSGSLGDATITNVDNVFTITPGSDEVQADITFTASDGVNIDTSASTFTLNLAPLVRYAGSTAPPTAGPNVGWEITTDRAGKFFVRSGSPHKIHMYTVSGEDLNYSGDLTSIASLSSPSLAFDQSKIMSVYGDILVLGDRNNDMGVNNGGAVHIFNHVTDTFLGSIITKGLGTQNFNFGQSVAVNSTHIFATTVTGSNSLLKLSLADFPRLLTSNDYSALPNFYEAVYTYGYGQGIGIQEGYGSNVRVNSRHVVVSTPLANSSAGRVRVYDIDTLNLIRELDGSTQFGMMIALNEDYLIVSQGGGTPTYGAKSINVYDMREGSVGNYLRNITLSKRYGGGFSMELSGKYAAIGSADISNNDGGTGGVAVYDVSTGTLIKNVTESVSGRGVSISGTYIIAGNAAGNSILKYN